MPMGTSEVGKRGEEFAAAWLKAQGWKVIERNARYPWGELDLVAYDPEGVLVFVEVKTLRNIRGVAPERQLAPEDEMTGAKLRKFRRVAEGYANAHSSLVNGRCGFRLDVIALRESEEGYAPVRYENIG